MPAISKKQFKFMAMIANNPEKANKKGLSSSKAKEFISHNKGKMAYKNLPAKK